MNEELVIRYRNQELSNAEIAAKLGVSERQVNNCVSSLIRQKRLERRPQGAPTRRNLLSIKRNQLIIQMRNEGQTLEAIGNCFGLTMERVRQIIFAIKQEYGDHVLRNYNELWTVPQAALHFKVPEDDIRSLCKSGEIPSQRIGDGNWYRLTNEAIKKLADHPLIQDRKKCVVCGKKCVVPQNQPVILCSEECRKKRTQLKARELFSGSPETARLLHWQKKVWTILRDRALTPVEQWISFSAAVAMTGLKEYQLIYLRRRGVVAGHLVKGQGTRAYRYDPGQMKVVAQVYREYLEQQTV